MIPPLRRNPKSLAPGVRLGACEILGLIGAAAAEFQQRMGQPLVIVTGEYDPGAALPSRQAASEARP